MGIPKGPGPFPAPNARVFAQEIAGAYDQGLWSPPWSLHLRPQFWLQFWLLPRKTSHSPWKLVVGRRQAYPYELASFLGDLPWFSGGETVGLVTAKSHLYQPLRSYAGALARRLGEKNARGDGDLMDFLSKWGTRWWQLKDFLCSSLFGEDEPNLTI